MAHAITPVILHKHNNNSNILLLHKRARARSTDRSYPVVSSSKPFQNDKTNYARSAVFFFHYVTRLTVNPT